MIRIFLSKRFLNSVSSLTSEQRQRAETVLQEVMEGFGDAHRHAGLGLRKLSRGFFECRLDLRLRIVLYSRAEGLLAYDVMTHDQVKKLLRSH